MMTGFTNPSHTVHIAETGKMCGGDNYDELMRHQSQVELLGKITSSEVRLPMTSMDEASIGTLKNAMQEVGLLS